MKRMKKKRKKKGKMKKKQRELRLGVERGKEQVVMMMMTTLCNPPRSSVQRTLRTKNVYQERQSQKPAPSEEISTLTSLLFDCSIRRSNHQDKAWNQVKLRSQKVQGQVKILSPTTTIEKILETQALAQNENNHCKN